MKKLIIDKNLSKYIPQFNLSKIVDNDFNINKYDKVYIFIDDIKIFHKYYNYLTYDNIIYLYDKNEIFNNRDLIIEVIDYDIIETNLKTKVVKHKFIYDYIFSV